MTDDIMTMPSITYMPKFDVPEPIAKGLGDKRIGQKIKAIINYEVVEKTKSYVVLKVNHFTVNPSARRLR